MNHYGNKIWINQNGCAYGIDTDIEYLYTVIVQYSVFIRQWLENLKTCSDV